MRPGIGQRVIWGVCGALWLGAVGAGLTALMSYDNAPGIAADAPAGWPADSGLARDPAGPTLVMLAHPRCDCTRASLAELAELLARAPRPPRAYVVFIRPGHVPGGWEQTALWRRAVDIPGVTVIRDDDGAEARRFGVKTSGQVLLYDAAGRLQYAGGTTGARGKTGNNAGRDAILATIAGLPAEATLPVFGCAMFSDADAAAEAAPDAHESHAR
jgi:hypothetical protein